MTIVTALDVIRGQLEAALRKAEARADGWVSLSNLLEPDGRPLVATQGKIVMALANITHAPETRNLPLPPAGQPAGPPALELLVLFFANFHGQNYAHGIAAISATVDFFQRTPVFTKANVLHLDPAIGQLTMTPVNLDVATLASLMAMHATRYLPSVCYTLRLIPTGT